MREKIVNGFEEYIINDSGINDESVWSIKTKQFLKSRRMPNNYIQICFTVDGKHYYQYLHILLAKAFIPNLDNKPTVNHKNHIRCDNRLENLEWATKPEQMDYITKENISKARKGKHYPKLSEAMKGMTPWNKGIQCAEKTKEKISKSKNRKVFQYTLNGELVAVYESASDAEKYGFSKYCIAKCCQGKQKQHKGYIFKYN